MSHDYVTVYHGVVGSHLYGTNRPDSDKDHVEVVLPRIEELFGLGDKFVSLKHKVTDTEDVQVHSVNKFMKLVKGGNAYAVESLFVTARHAANLGCHEWYEYTVLTRAPAEILQLSNVIHGHLGFAIGQYKKMVTCNPHMGERRREMAAEYGYDVKYAAHALRLVWQIKDLLTMGFFVFPMNPERVAIVHEIRDGKWTLTAVERVFNDGLREVESLKDSCKHIDDVDKTDVINRRLREFYMSEKVQSAMVDNYVLRRDKNLSVPSVPS